jgi:molybdopterin-guanine dinucleotide biosynthesis protein A
MGQDKACVMFEEEPLLARTCRRLASVADPIVAVAAPGQQLPPLPPAIRLTYDSTPHEGPLAGFFNGLQSLPSSTMQNTGEQQQVALCSCDLPFVNGQVLQEMGNRLSDTSSDCIGLCLTHHSFPQLQHSVWKFSVLDTVRQLRAEGARSLRALLETGQVVQCNANDFADIAAADTYLTDVNDKRQLELALNARKHSQSHVPKTESAEPDST